LIFVGCKNIGFSPPGLFRAIPPAISVPIAHVRSNSCIWHARCLVLITSIMVRWPRASWVVDTRCGRTRARDAGGRRARDPKGPHSPLTLERAFPDAPPPPSSLNFIHILSLSISHTNKNHHHHHAHAIRYARVCAPSAGTSRAHKRIR